LRNKSSEKEDAAKYRAQRLRAREAQAVRRAKRREAGDIQVQAWTSRELAQEARSRGFVPAVVWVDAGKNLPDTLYYYDTKPTTLLQDDTRQVYMFLDYLHDKEENQE